MSVHFSRRGFLKASVGTAAVAWTNQGSAAAAGGGPIIDTHVHLYDPTRPKGVPWPGPGDALLYRPVLPDEWERLVKPFGPGGMIVVEASRWVEDNQWLLDLAERHAATLQDGMLGIVGVVGSLPLEDDASAALIEKDSPVNGTSATMAAGISKPMGG